MSKGLKKEILEIEKKIISKGKNKEIDIENENEIMRRKKIKLLFIQGALISFSSALLSYVLSSYLAQFISDKYVSLVYLVSNIICFFLTLHFGKLIKQLGIFRASIINLLIMLFALLLQPIIKENLFTVVFTIILYQVSSALVYVFIDYYVEKYSLDGTTGDTKGLQWTVMNFTYLFGPLCAGFLLDKVGFNIIFVLSAIFVIPIIIIADKHFKNIKVSPTRTVKIRLHKILHNNSVSRISMVNFLLNIFYCIMSIYTPIYMNKVLNLSWDKIGIILAIILIPFVLFQYPAGKIADKYLGQKELLMTAIIIMGASTIAMFFSNNVIVFSIALFSTRIGASVVEVMRDVHFYKNVGTKNLDYISFFKSMASFAYIIGPIIASITLTFFPLKSLFLILGIIVIVFGLIVTWKLKDTKVNFKSRFIEM